MIDSSYSIETPEGIDLTMPIAGPVVRILAYSLDACVRICIYIILGIGFQFLGKVGIGFTLITFFLIEWFYPVFFEVLNNGMTPGKKKMGIKVIHDDSTPVGWSASIIRNLLRAVDFLPLAYMTGVLSMVLNRQFKRLGDLTAGTLVVYCRHPLETPNLPEIEAVQSPLPLTLSEQRAIVNFAERHKTLSSDRSEELANILNKIIGEKGPQAVKKLYQIANGLLGGYEAAKF